jgi:hypothetical protein
MQIDGNQPDYGVGAQAAEARKANNTQMGSPDLDLSTDNVHQYPMAIFDRV